MHIMDIYQSSIINYLPLFIAKMTKMNKIKEEMLGRERNMYTK